MCPGSIGRAPLHSCWPVFIKMWKTNVSETSVLCERRFSCPWWWGGPEQAQTDPGWGVWSQQSWTAGVSLGVVTVRAGVLICLWFPCFVCRFCILFGFQLIFKFWNLFLHILVPKTVPYAICDGVWPSVPLNNFLCFLQGHTCAEPKLFFLKKYKDNSGGLLFKFCFKEKASFLMLCWSLTWWMLPLARV